MPATPLPPLADLEGSGSTPNSAAFRLAIGNLRRSWAWLFGTTGEVADAVAALGLNKVSGDCLQTRVAKPAIVTTGVSSLYTRSTAPVFTPKSAASTILVKCTVGYAIEAVDVSSLLFGVYQDASLVSDLYGGEKAVNATGQVPSSSENVPIVAYQRDSGYVTLQAVISNSALTARNFFLKSSSPTSGAQQITSALWEISEYVA